MPVRAIRLSQRSRSLLISDANSSGEQGATLPPMSSMLRRVFGSAKALGNAPLSFVMIYHDVPAWRHAIGCAVCARRYDCTATGSVGKGSSRQLPYGTVGVGSILHLAGELLERSAGIDLVDIPYKGGAQALPELLASRTQLQFDFAATSMPHIKAGTLRALMVTTSN
jgi:tripartite tricarboxylate transporter family receptor